MGSAEEQEFVRRLEEQLRQLKVADVLTQTTMTISQLAWHRLAAETRDLDQARLAIEALRALVPVLRGSVTDELSRDLQQVVANLQLAYAGAVAQGAAGPAPAPDEDDPAESAASPEAGGAAAGGGGDEGEQAAEEPLPGDDAPAEPVTDS